MIEPRREQQEQENVSKHKAGDILLFNEIYANEYELMGDRYKSVRINRGNQGDWVTKYDGKFIILTKATLAGEIIEETEAFDKAWNDTTRNYLDYARLDIKSIRQRGNANVYDATVVPDSTATKNYKENAEFERQILHVKLAISRAKAIGATIVRTSVYGDEEQEVTYEQVLQEETERVKATLELNKTPVFNRKKSNNPRKYNYKLKPTVQEGVFQWYSDLYLNNFGKHIESSSFGTNNSSLNATPLQDYPPRNFSDIRSYTLLNVNGRVCVMSKIDTRAHSMLVDDAGGELQPAEIERLQRSGVSKNSEMGLATQELIDINTGEVVQTFRVAYGWMIIYSYGDGMGSNDDNEVTSSTMHLIGNIKLPEGLAVSTFSAQQYNPKPSPELVIATAAEKLLNVETEATTRHTVGSILGSEGIILKSLGVDQNYELSPISELNEQEIFDLYLKAYEVLKRRAEELHSNDPIRLFNPHQPTADLVREPRSSRLNIELSVLHSRRKFLAEKQQLLKEAGLEIPQVMSYEFDSEGNLHPLFNETGEFKYVTSSDYSALTIQHLPTGKDVLFTSEIKYEHGVANFYFYDKQDTRKLVAEYSVPLKKEDFAQVASHSCNKICPYYGVKPNRQYLLDENEQPIAWWNEKSSKWVIGQPSAARRPGAAESILDVFSGHQTEEKKRMQQMAYAQGLINGKPSPRLQEVYQREDIVELENFDATNSEHSALTIQRKRQEWLAEEKRVKDEEARSREEEARLERIRLRNEKSALAAAEQARKAEQAALTADQIKEKVLELIGQELFEEITETFSLLPSYYYQNKNVPQELSRLMQAWDHAYKNFNLHGNNDELKVVAEQLRKQDFALLREYLKDIQVKNWGIHEQIRVKAGECISVGEYGRFEKLFDLPVGRKLTISKEGKSLRFYSSAARADFILDEGEYVVTRDGKNVYEVKFAENDVKVIKVISKVVTQGENILPSTNTDKQAEEYSSTVVKQEVTEANAPATDEMVKKLKDTLRGGPALEPETPEPPKPKTEKFFGEVAKITSLEQLRNKLAKAEAADKEDDIFKLKIMVALKGGYDHRDLKLLETLKTDLQRRMESFRDQGNIGYAGELSTTMVALNEVISKLKLIARNEQIIESLISQAIAENGELKPEEREKFKESLIQAIGKNLDGSFVESQLTESLADLYIAALN